MNTAQERLSLLTIHAKSKNLKALAQVLGVNPQVLYDIRNGKTKEFSGRLASKIFLTFPEIDEVWLTTGEGDMIASNANSDQGATNRDFCRQDYLIETIYSQQETIAQLTAIISNQLRSSAPKKENAG